jgi:dienelactone hydrolase
LISLRKIFWTAADQIYAGLTKIKISKAGLFVNADHAFANPGDRCVKEAAELAWNRTVVFLENY